MNIGELEAICQSIKDKSIDVMIKQVNDEFTYAPSENAALKKVRFKGDGIPKKEEPIIECLVITDEI